MMRVTICVITSFLFHSWIIFYPRWSYQPAQIDRWGGMSAQVEAQLPLYRQHKSPFVYEISSDMPDRKALFTFSLTVGTAYSWASKCFYLSPASKSYHCQPEPRIRLPFFVLKDLFTFLKWETTTRLGVNCFCQDGMTIYLPPQSWEVLCTQISVITATASCKN